jgi:hypothetical protein
MHPKSMRPPRRERLEARAAAEKAAGWPLHFTLLDSYMRNPVVLPGDRYNIGLPPVTGISAEVI